MNTKMMLTTLLGFLTGCGTLTHKDGTVFSQEPSAAKVEKECRVKLIVFSALVEAALDAANSEQITKLSARDLGCRSWPLDPKYPIRAMLTQKAHSLPTFMKERCRDYLLRYPYWSTVYHAYLLESFGPPPGFGPTGRQYSMNDQIYEGRNELGQLLAELYACDGGEKGWQGVIDEFAKYQLSPPYITGIHDRLTKYLRVTPALLGEDMFREYCPSNMSVIYNPLMTPGIGCGAFPDANFSWPTVFIVGPWTTEEGLRTCLSHEFMHPYLNTLRQRAGTLRDALERTASCMKSVKGNRWGYDNWSSYFFEEFIRATTSRIEGGRQTQFQHHGVILRVLKDYEKSDWSLEQLLLRTLEQIDAETQADKRAEPTHAGDRNTCAR
jgi:hypothetical protein